MARTNLTKSFTEASPRLSFMNLLVGLFAMLAAAPRFVIFGRSTAKQEVKPVIDPAACVSHFNTHSYGQSSSGAVMTYLIGEIHGDNENKVAACLATLLKEGDRLLLETEGKDSQQEDNSSQEIPCDLMLLTKGNYLKQLARRLQGLTLPEMSVYMTKENNYLAEQADIYEFASRRGSTNQALVEHMHLHQRLLQGSKNNLFVIAGARHLDVAVNQHLKQATESAMSTAVTISLPKNYPL